MINQVKQFRKVHLKVFTLKLLPQKIHFKTAISKKKEKKRINSKLLPQNTFQNFYLKNPLRNCSLKNCISKLLFQKLISKLLPQKVHFKTFISEIHFKIAPSKNAFQNCYFSSIVIEGFKTLLFFTKSSKKKKAQIQLLKKPKFFQRLY